MNARTIASCRVCESGRLLPWLDLGAQPPSNAFYRPDEKPPPRYPLIVNRCTVCQHHQLSVRVDPAELYRDYPYRSGVSSTFATHCDELAKLSHRLSRGTDRVLDVGCNDGTLLKSFWRLGLNPKNLAGVDPTSDPDVPFPVVRGYFPDVELPHHDYGIILTLNTFNAVDDLKGFVSRVADLLTPLGVWVIEVPYLVNLIRGLAFDTIYHEHLSYWLIAPLMRLLEPHGLRPVAIYRRGIHAGTIRIVIGRSDIAEVGTDWAWWEEVGGYHDAGTYARFLHAMEAARIRFKAFRETHKGKWVGFGAAAKMTVLSEWFGLTPKDLAYVVDETPQKQGKISPTGMLVVPPTMLGGDPHSRPQPTPPDYVLCFAWNFAEEILPKVKKWAPNAKLVVPLPEVKVYG